MLDLQDTSSLELILALAVAALIGVAVGVLAVAGLRLLARRWNVSVLAGRLWRSPVVALFVILGLRIVVDAAGRIWSESVSYLLWIGEVAAVAWLVIVIARTLEKAALAKHPDTGLTAAASRHVRTKITLLSRVAVAATIVIAIGVVLFSIPEVRTVGITLLASAGVLGIVAGLAAQTSLANIFAGVQIAFTDAIRVGDIVRINGAAGANGATGVTGRIEEITLTYVVVAVWDGTSLILPCTYFNTTPFENFTHSGAAVSGQVVFACDWDVPLPELRAELGRVLASSADWDGRRGELRVQDASGPTLQLVATVSSRDGDTLDRLRYDVREAIVTFLQRARPDGMPRTRLEVVDDAAAAPASAPASAGEPDRSDGGD